MTPRQRWTLVATVIGSGTVFLDGTVVNVALPSIGRDLPASLVGVLEGQTYIVSGYLAALAALLILSGALSDHYGRKRIYMIGLAGFGTASALCGLAPTMEWLIVFRIVQGAAGALLVPGSLALISSCFTGDERARAFGIWTSATSGLTLLGPIVGGLLVDTVGWRAVFLINVPVIAFALWVMRTHVQESVDERSRGRFDWLGAAVAAVAIGGLAFGLVRGQEEAWADPVAWASIAIGARRAHRVPDPHGDPRAPARAPQPVPLADVRDDQPGHVLHLRRAVRDVQLPGPRVPGRPRLHGARGRGDGAARSA